MMNFRNTITCITYFLLTVLSLQAQEKVSGCVYSDEDDLPMANAFVSFVNGNRMVSYCYTDNNGNFSAEFPDEKPETIKVSFIGYTTYVSPLTGNIMEIRLKPATHTIDKVVFVEQVIKQKGDTTSYDAAAFRDKDDLVLSDILNKIPEIAVTSSGGIIHEGSRIGNFYVEGLELMGNRYGVITRNLSAKDIERIEVYRKHQHIKALKGVSASDKSAVNIILKESAKNSWLFNGDVALGYSDKFLFEARAMVSRFSKKSQDLYLIKGNSIGSDIREELIKQQYMGKSGAFIVNDASIDSDFNSEITPPAFFVELPKPLWVDNISGIGTFNHLQVIGDDLQMRNNVSISAEENWNNTVVNERIRVEGAPEIIVNESDSRRNTIYYFDAETNFEKNTDKLYLTDAINVSGQYYISSSESNGGNQTFSQNYVLPSLKVSNELSTVVKFANNKAIKINSNIKYFRNSHSAGYQTDGRFNAQTYLTDNFVAINNVRGSISRNKWLFSLNGHLNIKYFNKKTELNCLVDESFETSGNYGVTTLLPGISASISYIKGKSKLYFTLPLYLQAYFINAEKNRYFLDFSPMVNYELTISRDWRFSSNIIMGSSHSGSESLGNAVIMTDYRTLVKPSGFSRNNSLSASLGLKYSNNPAMFYSSLTANYIVNSSDKSSSSYYKDDYTILSYIDRYRRTSSYGGTFTLNKYFGIKALQLKLLCSYYRFHMNETLQNVLFDYMSDNTMVTLNASTSALKWLSLEADVSYSLDRTPGISSLNKIQSKGKLLLTPISKLQIGCNIWHQWWNFSGDNITMNMHPIISANVSWLFKKFRIFAECNNILNTNELKQETHTPAMVSTKISALRPRSYIVGIRMSI